jgi:hypothetical protein
MRVSWNSWWFGQRKEQRLPKRGLERRPHEKKGRRKAQKALRGENASLSEN